MSVATNPSTNNAGNFYLNGYLVEAFIDNLFAFPGGGQTNATQLSSEVNRITTVATAGDSIKLAVPVRTDCFRD